MKRQYLGDSKDSFKWDYHHYLAEVLGYPRLNVVLMMTPDDGGRDGNTAPDLFPARQEILTFCNELRNERKIEHLYKLPSTTGAHYKVALHKPHEFITNQRRASYFAGLSAEGKQLVFLDPDNGFEPESNNEKHVRYLDVEELLQQITNDSVITVFQHFRFVKFDEDFARIRKRLISGHSTALFWHSLMFVAISASPEVIESVREVNAKYASNKPVEIVV